MATDETGIPMDDAYRATDNGPAPSEMGDAAWADVVPHASSWDEGGAQAVGVDYGAPAEGVAYGPSYDGDGQADFAGTEPAPDAAQIGDILSGAVEMVPSATDHEVAYGELSPVGADPYGGDATVVEDYQDMPQPDVDVYVPPRPAGMPTDVPDVVETRVMAPQLASDELADEDAESQAAVAALEARRRRRRHRNIAIVAVLALIAIGVGAFVLLRGAVTEDEAEVAVAPLTDMVVRRDFTSTVASSGPLQPISSTTVTPPIEGTIAEMRVAEGDTVAAGDVLFIIKSETLDKAVADANAQLSNANAAATRAQDAVTAAYDAYNQAVDGYNSGTITEAEINLLAANITSAETARDQANAAVTAANNAVSNANAALAQCTVTAPTGGVITSVKTDGATTASPLGYASVQIADISQMRVTVQVNEMDISSIRAGQMASVSFSALPDVRLDATVETIASTATGAGEDGSMPTGGVVTFGVTLLIPAPVSELKTGMTAQVSIITQDARDALVIPLVDVSVDPTDPSVGIVSVVTDTDTFEAESRSVTLGARDAADVVVLSGLEEGDLILAGIADPGMLTDEMAVA